MCSSDLARGIPARAHRGVPRARHGHTSGAAGGRMSEGPDPAEARVISHSVMSRAWGLRVNTIAASNLVSRPLRRRIYRHAGLEVETDDIYPHCYFHTCDIRIGPGSVINYGCYFENVGRVEIGPRTKRSTSQLNNVRATSSFESKPST